MGKTILNKVKILRASKEALVATVTTLIVAVLIACGGGTSGPAGGGTGAASDVLESTSFECDMSSSATPIQLKDSGGAAKITISMDGYHNKSFGLLPPLGRYVATVEVIDTWSSVNGPIGSVSTWANYGMTLGRDIRIGDKESVNFFV